MNIGLKQAAAQSSKGGGHEKPAESSLPDKREVERKKTVKESPPIKPVNTNKAFFAVDENENVVIRVVDSEGRIVRQFPPEEYLRTVEVLKGTVQNLLHLEA
jgi:uncharacterized FlaG/YvyC family protein